LVVIITFTILIAFSSPVFANMPWILIPIGAFFLWWSIPLTLAIESVTLKKIFPASWKKVIWASIVINLASWILGGVALFLLLRIEDPELGRVIHSIVTNEGTWNKLPVLIMAGFVAFGGLIELAIICLLFRSDMSISRALIFLLINSLTSGSTFLQLVPGDFWNPVTESEVELLEAFYEPEIQYIEYLVQVGPDYIVRPEGGGWSRPTPRFEDEWLQAQIESAALYRFMSLDLFLAGGSAALVEHSYLTPNVEAKFVMGNLQVIRFSSERGFKGNPEVGYSYKLKTRARGLDFQIAAYFDGTLIVVKNSSSQGE